MSYTLSQMEREPILVASLTGQITDEIIIDMFGAAAQLLGVMPDPSCLICDFRQVTALNTEGYDVLGESLAESIRDIQRELTVFITFLSGNTAVRELGEYLTELGFNVPTFPDMDMTLSYINLKIDLIHLKNTLNSSDTVGELDDTARIMVQNVAAQFMSKRTDLGTDEFPDGAILRLEAVGMNKTTLIFPSGTLVIGRRDSNNMKPDVDLSFWGGYRSGVSRRHAQLTRANDHRLFLTDLDSSNGTYLNGERMSPEQAYMLRDGDEVKFGHLVTRLWFEHRTLK